MQFIQRTGFILFFLSATGCASLSSQTSQILKSEHSLPRAVQVQGVPFIDQAVGYCGPATLTMAMNWAGKEVVVNDIAEQVYTPKMKGSLQSDMMSAGRRNGMMAVPIEGLESLLTELAAGHPVIVFENLGLSVLPRWHYAVVVGYDLDRREVILHSGHEPYKREDMHVFENSWKLAKYWGLVVLPPDKIAVAANEIANSTAAVGLENAGRLYEAELAYKAVLDRWPQSLTAMIGLGNISYQMNDYQESAKWLRRAVQNHPESAAAKHNLKVAEDAAKKNIRR